MKSDYVKLKNIPFIISKENLKILRDPRTVILNYIGKDVTLDELLKKIDDFFVNISAIESRLSSITDESAIKSVKKNLDAMNLILINYQDFIKINVSSDDLTYAYDYYSALPEPNDQILRIINYLKRILNL